METDKISKASGFQTHFVNLPEGLGPLGFEALFPCSDPLDPGGLRFSIPTGACCNGAKAVGPWKHVEL